MGFALAALALVLTFLVIVVRDLEVVDLRLKCWFLDFRFRGKSKKRAHRSS
jgi:hypothetical protein